WNILVRGTPSKMTPVAAKLPTCRFKTARRGSCRHQRGGDPRMATAPPRHLNRGGGRLPPPPPRALPHPAPAGRLGQGHRLDAVFREVFPIPAHEGNRSLHYERFELDEPEHDLAACRRLGRSYTRPLFLWLRVEGAQSVAERVAFGALPVMFGGGEFLI